LLNGGVQASKLVAPVRERNLRKQNERKQQQQRKPRGGRDQ